MTTYDPFHFVFDKSVRDSANGMRIDVTVVDPEADIQINLASGQLSIPFFLKPYHARLLGRYLLQACDAYDLAMKPVSENLTSCDD